MKTLKTLLITLLCLMLLGGLTACGSKMTADPWASAKYTQDTELGEGATTVKVTVQVNDHKVVFTVHTDKTILGDALIDNGLVEGEAGAYGLYIKKVNGITADYDVDQSYWNFCMNGETMMVGVNGQTIADGEAYELVYTK